MANQPNLNVMLKPPDELFGPEEQVAIDIPRSPYETLMGREIALTQRQRLLMALLLPED